MSLWPAEANAIEIGPGRGVLTQHLLKNYRNLRAIELDRDLIPFLRKAFPELEGRLVHGDFLKTDLSTFFEGMEFAVIGNFPYNISSQIVFKILDNNPLIPLMVGMFQKEVAKRICAQPGTKDNGILSLRIQAYYEPELMFVIGPESFNPPPRVDSAIVVLRRKTEVVSNYSEKCFTQILKMAFNQRRKKMRNSLKSLLAGNDDPIFQKRPEELSFEEFVNIARQIEKNK